MNDNIFYEVASKLLKGRSCYKALKKESLIDKLNVLNFEGATPLDVAIDYENWNTLKLFIQFNIKEDTIVKAIGELLSHYWHIGSSIIDKFIFQLIFSLLAGTHAMEETSRKIYLHVINILLSPTTYVSAVMYLSVLFRIKND